MPFECRDGIVIITLSSSLSLPLLLLLVSDSLNQIIQQDLNNSSISYRILRNECQSGEDVKLLIGSNSDEDDNNQVSGITKHYIFIIIIIIIIIIAYCIFIFRFNVNIIITEGIEEVPDILIVVVIIDQLL